MNTRKMFARAVAGAAMAVMVSGCISNTAYYLEEAGRFRSCMAVRVLIYMPIHLIGITMGMRNI